jgi:hypothetical protein
MVNFSKCFTYILYVMKFKLFVYRKLSDITKGYSCFLLFYWSITSAFLLKTVRILFYSSYRLSTTLRAHHVTRHNTPIYNILSTAPQLSISQKALETLHEDGNVMPKHV